MPNATTPRSGGHSLAQHAGEAGVLGKVPNKTRVPLAIGTQHWRAGLDYCLRFAESSARRRETRTTHHNVHRPPFSTSYSFLAEGE